MKKDKKISKPSKSDTLYPKPFRSFIGSAVERARREVYHHSFNIDINFMAEQITSDIHENMEIAAQITISMSYRSAIIQVYPELYKIYKTDKEKAALIVLHELCHLITEPLTELVKERFISPKQLVDVNESTTELIKSIAEVAFWDNLKKDLHTKEPKKKKVKPKKRIAKKVKK